MSAIDTVQTAFWWHVEVPPAPLQLSDLDAAALERHRLVASSSSFAESRSWLPEIEAEIARRRTCTDGTRDHFPVGDGAICNCGDPL